MKIKKVDTQDWPDLVGHPEFLSLLARHLPDVFSQVEQDDLELLHVVMGRFESIALHAYRNRLIVANQYFDFANQVLIRADSYVMNALKVSFIEGFALGLEDDQSARAWMPERLQRFYDAYQTWYNGLVSRRNFG